MKKLIHYLFIPKLEKQRIDYGILIRNEVEQLEVLIRECRRMGELYEIFDLLETFKLNFSGERIGKFYYLYLIARFKRKENYLAKEYELELQDVI